MKSLSAKDLERSLSTGLILIVKTNIHCRSFKVSDGGFSAMPKRGIGDDFERQPGDYRDGDANDSNASNPFGGSNFGGPGISGRK